MDYVQRIVHFTRTHSGFAYGLSPRGTLALVHCARAWAYIHNRDHLLPDDVQAVLEPVVEHRLRGCADHSGQGGAGLTAGILNQVDVIKKAS